MWHACTHVHIHTTHKGSSHLYQSQGKGQPRTYSKWGTLRTRNWPTHFPNLCSLLSSIFASQVFTGYPLWTGHILGAGVGLGSRPKLTPAPSERNDRTQKHLDFVTYSSVISLLYNDLTLELLGSSNLPASASRAAASTGTHTPHPKEKQQAVYSI